ncbi:MAG: AAA-like domain-containing protein, partial [Oscillospiraceae bacterium]|nr:AAA-like domain-containing protein [Oscillospiraceae bacterium]
MKYFNVTGLCVKGKHYMADISAKLDKIADMVARGRYFTINRARQYGKTTTLFLLEETLQDEYTVISISFEGLGDESFESPAAFCRAFTLLIHDALEFTDAPEEYKESWLDKDVVDFIGLSRHITKMCKGRKLVLMIDEVDKTSNNRVYLHFLGVLRDKFLKREKDRDHTFHSVILAGVYDIKNIKLKMINEGAYTPSATENRLYNSPWNIAVSFSVDMSFSPPEIATMLSDYESDHHTGMEVDAIAGEIYEYTSGYPYLVSRICQCIDEELDKDWTKTGVQNAVKAILEEKSVLFDDIAKNMENNKELYDFLYSLLIVGENKTYAITSPVIEWASMFGYIKKGKTYSGGNGSGPAVIANKIFEMLLSYHFCSKDENVTRMDSSISRGLRYEVARDGVFDMELCLRKFAEHYRELFSEADAPFLERHGRLLFLSYLKPLVNGQGFYHIESEFTDLRRMDIVVDYGSEQFIVELK